jgi:hypothetical protein
MFIEIIAVEDNAESVREFQPRATPWVFETIGERKLMDKASVARIPKIGYG